MSFGMLYRKFQVNYQRIDDISVEIRSAILFFFIILISENSYSSRVISVLVYVSRSQLWQYGTLVLARSFSRTWKKHDGRKKSSLEPKESGINGITSSF